MSVVHGMMPRSLLNRQATNAKRFGRAHDPFYLTQREPQSAIGLGRTHRRLAGLELHAVVPRCVHGMATSWPGFRLPDMLGSSRSSFCEALSQVAEFLVRSLKSDERCRRFPGNGSAERDPRST